LIHENLRCVKWPHEPLGYCSARTDRRGRSPNRALASG